MAVKRKPRKATPPVRVGRSAIHGRGLFATRDIPADALILAVEGRPTNQDGEHVIWVYAGEEMEGFEILNEARYVNHSSTPNAVFLDDELYALRDIAAGEEITHHYGADWDDID